jgi:hypothetical protein
VAAITGFLLNLLANIYYDIFIIHSIKWENEVIFREVLQKFCRKIFSERRGA